MASPLSLEEPLPDDRHGEARSSIAMAAHGRPAPRRRGTEYPVGNEHAEQGLIKGLMDEYFTVDNSLEAVSFAGNVTTTVAEMESLSDDLKQHVGTIGASITAAADTGQLGTRLVNHIRSGSMSLMPSANWIPDNKLHTAFTLMNAASAGFKIWVDQQAKEEERAKGEVSQKTKNMQIGAVAATFVTSVGMAATKPTEKKTLGAKEMADQAPRAGGAHGLLDRAHEGALTHADEIAQGFSLAGNTVSNVGGAAALSSSSARNVATAGSAVTSAADIWGLVSGIHRMRAEESVTKDYWHMAATLTNGLAAGFKIYVDQRIGQERETAAGISAEAKAMQIVAVAATSTSAMLMALTKPSEAKARGNQILEGRSIQQSPQGSLTEVTAAAAGPSAAAHVTTAPEVTGAAAGAGTDTRQQDHLVVKKTSASKLV
jgi:hypothetical protein